MQDNLCKMGALYNFSSSFCLKLLEGLFLSPILYISITYFSLRLIIFLASLSTVSRS